MVLGYPWAWVKSKEDTIFALNTTFLDHNDINLGLEGYSIDLLKKLAERMKFEYEIIPAPENFYGFKENGTWNGLVGALVDGDIDISVAALTMTTEREEGIQKMTH